MLSALLFAPPMQEGADPGQLTVIGKDGKPGMLVPLKKTNVNVDIAGISARVTIVQTFENPSRTPIEAVYTFPMSQNAAVDRMRMNVAGRIVVGQMRKRDEARRIYEAAKANGQVASLLDQERPNVFTQNVANILPGATVEVEVSYVETLKYEDGQYEFNFPMVVGPRYLPATTPDPGKVSPPYVAKDMRTGTTVSMNVHLDAGAELDTVQSVLHQVDIRKNGGNEAFINLKRADEIPNRDFILRYKLKAAGIKEQVVSHANSDGSGSFCLVLNPPKNVAPDVVRPREVLFVMDQSGSQSGFPIEKSKELTLALIDLLRPTDTFNVISFSNGAHALWSAARPNTSENLNEAKARVKSLEANGGTEFMPAIEMALSKPAEGGRVKLVVFNTDGFVGNEFEILDRIQKYRQNARMFTFGIGNGVNNFLIDAMSVEGRGGSETVTLADKADAAVQRFVKRTQTPVLTDVSLDFQGVQVTDVSPSHPEDLFSGKPVIVTGRYLQPGKGSVTISGRTGAGSWSREILLDFTKSNAGDGVTSLWARRAVEDLTRKDWMAQARKPDEQQRSATVQAITDIGLKYGIMTAYTSFVAVEQKVVNVGGKQRTVNVPVEMTDGVDMDMGRDMSGFGGRTKTLSSGAVGGGGFGGAGLGGGGSNGLYRGQAPQSQPASPSLGKARKEAFEKQQAGESLDELNRQIKAGTVKATIKVDKELLKSKGEVAVQVLVSELDDKTLAALKRAGLKVEDKDERFKLVFGTLDAKQLEDLAKVEQVVHIDPVEG
ncbi:MAG: VWA domain-containing protein [Armatimonadetes bacterium]|nr:VWA domain-containing protein [Armatimonadota bacterium]